MGKCAVSVYGGRFVKTGMSDIATTGLPAWNWDYNNDYFVGATISRSLLSFKNILDFEPELGVGQRFGVQHETEFWAALYVRYSAFPWNDYLMTSIAVSTGVNYATGVSDIEQKRGGQGGGSRLLHFLSPEITFALPSAPDKQLFFRFHHRSGAYGIISDTKGGSQYATGGFRYKF
ncbi:hypothetical protein [Pseudovibrio axinellae]|nr:hypothetical protein [Pseudovibrio axinellae]